MTNTTSGVVRGIVYPLVATLAAWFLAKVGSSGWFTASGALVITAIVGGIEHKMGILTGSTS